MLEIVDQIKSDVQRRRISFPTWESLHVPLRSTLTGKRESSESNSLTLLDSALRNIFVNEVNWSHTYRALFGYLDQSLSRDSQVRHRVLGLGPGAEPLVSAPTDVPVDSRISITANILDLVYEVFADNIAVVGVSANYPSGKGLEKFWETLEQAMSAVSEVSQLLTKLPETRGITIMLTDL